jgi:(1->4)-alpha-D-glucan 1-alpha-D-glucosylmutase
MRIPDATYRVQFNLNFRFADAEALVPYLQQLGISHLYASPRFKARRGSSHGYDVADPWRINSDLGTEEEFDSLAQKLQYYEMGLLLDIVPNHMVASAENPWWMDVLENGLNSRYRAFFDIDWQPRHVKAPWLQENRVVLPVLADLYGNVLENQEIVLRLDENGFFFRYGDLRFPLDPKTYQPVLKACLDALSEAGSNGDVLGAGQALLERIESLPAQTNFDVELIEARKKAANEIKKALWQLYQKEERVRNSFDEALRVLGGTKGVPESFDRLDALLSEQAYRLAHWRTAAWKINYRRFFDINDLIGLRVEEPEVFQARHAPIFRLIERRKVTGLRVDHVDGLHDPFDYLQRLQSSVNSSPTPGANPEGYYTSVEKILCGSESLPAEWPVAGTTGYDFVNAANALFVDPQGYKALEKAYADFTGRSTPFSEVCYARKKQVMEELFQGEVQALGQRLAVLAARDRRARDLPTTELIQALQDVTASLPIYRTYIRSGGEVPPRDRAYLEQAIEMARRQSPASQFSDSAFAFLRAVFLPDRRFSSAEREQEWLDFVMRWQQFSGAVMAKGLEDSTFFVHNSLISLNEVGSGPLREKVVFGAKAFHEFNQMRFGQWPHTMNATSTHDTKRSEDIRARINVLSDLPQDWKNCLERWSRWNKAKKQTIQGRRAPSPNEEVLLYQTMLGVWPLLKEEEPGLKDRLEAFMIKAAREARESTNWLSPNEEYENALRRFISAILDSSLGTRFLHDFTRLQNRIAFYGALNALSQVLLKITSPGLPDFYQGNEIWDFSLTDPDNRRPVDFRSRLKMLENLNAEESNDRLALLERLLSNWQDGRIKLYLIMKALHFRRAHQEIFLKGAYIPLGATGAKARNLCAFVRVANSKWSMTAVPRLATQLVPVGTFPAGGRAWGSSALTLPSRAPDHWVNIHTGETLAAHRVKGKRLLLLREVFLRLPFALLTPSEATAAAAPSLQ